MKPTQLGYGAAIFIHFLYMMMQGIDEISQGLLH
jgi:hypothetical protein